MNENKVDLSEAPAWLELPHKQEYWSTTGRDIVVRKKWWKRNLPGPCWLCLYYTAEDAEAHASKITGGVWVWDGRPASPHSLVETMRRARRDGCKGVSVCGFQHGKWVTIHEYRADEPLPKECQ